MTGADPRHPARIALGLVVLAMERLADNRDSGALATAVGLVELTAARATRAAGRVAAPPARVARWAAGLPLVRRPVARVRHRLGETAATARSHGRATVAASRAEAVSFVRSTVDDGLAWAQADAAPRLVDGLMPYLVDEVVPRLIDGVMPQIRTQVMPVLIEDLTADQRVRDLVVEQSRGMLDEAADELRTTTASADDRVEAAFRRLFGTRSGNNTTAG